MSIMAPPSGARAPRRRDLREERVEFGGQDGGVADGDDVFVRAGLVELAGGEGHGVALEEEALAVAAEVHDGLLHGAAPE